MHCVILSFGEVGICDLTSSNRRSLTNESTGVRGISQPEAFTVVGQSLANNYCANFKSAYGLVKNMLQGGLKYANLKVVSRDAFCGFLYNLFYERSTRPLYDKIPEQDSYPRG